MSMYYAVRCPSCLLTIYTVLSAERTKGFSVRSLPDESLAFYNCPFPLCDYHVHTNHDVNLYSNVSTHQKIYVSAGFTVAPRTPQTKAFRSKFQVDALALKLGITKDLPIKPLVPEAQAGDKAQAPKNPGEKDRQGDTPVPAVAPDTPQKNKTTRGQRWAAAEMEKAKRMTNEGRSNDEIAKEMERSVSAVKNKIAAMRDKGELPVLATPLKRKRDPTGVDDRPTYAT
ncbi:hypothetical protein INS49_007460 [Diaporthe citri]|uniref:uncharacterized protein n=1 Tax=Diaporthe citri TaxID=83186 RepID=UPI001C815850|nr:uncharacterized protein INS49_007460 [Diaporthe citri]KAG6353380.1 hypothetical protein INS49_007460 [Diaporthe citri]